ncbi:MAG TPA: MarR family transcriptional regulator [Mycobacteriales bacterium]|nr:MarR family transcriptional regulator [Mycobacteriales bacterium]
MTRPPSLDLPADGLMARIVRLNIAVTSALEDITSAAGIGLADYLVLSVIRRSPDGRSAPSAICEVLGRTSGGMSLALNRLEAAGWVRRSVDRTDRRRVILSLSPSGLRLATRVNDALHAWELSLDLPGDRDSIHLVIDDLAVAVAAARTRAERAS